MTLETITDNFQAAFEQCVPGTMCHADELMNERRNNIQLREQMFYSADGCVYYVENKKPTLRITRERFNPILKNINDVFGQLLNQDNYRLSRDDFIIMNAIGVGPDKLTIDLTKLTLKGNGKDWRGHDRGWSYYEISTHTPSFFNRGYDKLNFEERKLAESVYGQDNDFVENIKMLNDAGIKQTRIYVLSPKYVQKHAKEYAIVRPPLLWDFNHHSNFDACGYFIVGNVNVRGVRKQ